MFLGFKEKNEINQLIPNGYSLLFTHSYLLTHCYLPTHSYSLTLTYSYSLAYLLTRLLTHSPTYSLIYSLTHLLTRLAGYNTRMIIKNQSKYMKNALESYGKAENRPQILNNMYSSMPLEIAVPKKTQKSKNVFITST